MKASPVVMISSTARDLPDYRAQVMDACIRAEYLPKMMEHLPAHDADAVKTSLAMVDEADCYIGIFAHRYGYIPEGSEQSITEMEYDRAVEREIPRLIFFIHDDVPVKIKDIDRGRSEEKLNALKKRLQQEHVTASFKNPEDLRGLVLHSLSETRKQLEATEPAENTDDRLSSANLHYVSTIPEKGEPYIAHPYTLLQVKGLIGRRQELDLLTDWITKPGFNETTIFSIVAIGGMGKSALTWHWFNQIVPGQRSFAGKVWWSFYESDATFRNFITRTLAYVSGMPSETVNQMPLRDQQDALLQALKREPYLLVLDGLERILIAYAQPDAAFRTDTADLDNQTANRVIGACGMPGYPGSSSAGKHPLRKTTDVQAGLFLRQLTRVCPSRILMSTRLYPADLQTPGGSPVSNCTALYLEGLSDGDALELWRSYGAKGTRKTMLPIFRTFDKHPLLIQLLAYEVAEFHEAPGNFDAWRAANPDFNPFNLPLVQVQTEVLEYALRGLSPRELQTLRIIAGFRMPANMDTLKALLIRTENSDEKDNKPFATLNELDRTLTVLEDRGLLGWDRRSNRYDLHPIVRGIVWNRLSDTVRTDIYLSKQNHFEDMPMIRNHREVKSVDDLAPAVELFHTLIGLGNYDEAFLIFRDRISDSLLYRLSASHLRVELLERLFPDGLDAVPRLSETRNQAYTLNALAQGYQLCGRPGAAIRHFERADEIDIREQNEANREVNLCNISDVLRLTGRLYRSEASAGTALAICRDRQDRFDEGVSLYLLGLALAIRGMHEKADVAFQRSIRIWKDQCHEGAEGQVNAFLAQQMLWKGRAKTAKIFADRAWELADADRNENDYICAARLQGSAALDKNDFKTAEERLHHALTRARSVRLTEEELPALVAMAELNCRKKAPIKARELLEEVWEPAERGPYPLLHSDALIVLAQIELDAGNTEAAAEAATEAFCKAWCDGPPYAYQSGLEKTRKLLAALDVPEPELPPFDPYNFIPMPEIEINPDDSFDIKSGQ